MNYSVQGKQQEQEIGKMAIRCLSLAVCLRLKVMACSIDEEEDVSPTVMQSTQKTARST